MITIEKLNAFGANTAEGLARCFGNEALYLKLVATIPGEGNFDKLKNTLDAGDLENAFLAAHALKGVLGNLSLTPLYVKIADMTEHLRSKTDMDYSVQLADILAQKEELRKLCSE
ncbi:Hpt domain-containing protein [Fibrobacter sp.]|uniref:Hpt domain-containing protein n=1 Tax=Fibrobacter sp. TaxID=35828 RepID=UPI00388E0822